MPIFEPDPLDPLEYTAGGAFEPRFVKSMVAEKIAVHLRHRFSKHELQQISVNTRYDEMSACLIVDLESGFLAMVKDRVKVSIHEEFPETWWDAFKDRWFPSWFFGKWRFAPVSRVKINVEIDQKIYGPLCPHLEVPEREPHLEWMAEIQRDQP